MFGYIKVEKGELLVREYEAYKSIYCGLCRQLGKDYSVLSRFILSYDCTFYAMLLMSLNRSCSGFESKCCRFNPLKKCTYCKTESDSLSKAAAFSVISAYYKLVDDINDSKFFKRTAYKIIKPIFSRWRKKAAKRYPEIDDAVSTMLKEQIEAENYPDCSIDRACDPTAKMLSALLENEGRNENEKKILHQMGYGLGRWIYLIDAADDLAKDIKNNNFNPFNSNTENINEVINTNLSASLGLAFDAYELLELVDFKGIIDNIILKGLPITQKQVLDNRKD
ncbi:MAG: DUF5685 family protein [Ruminococcus sp.]